MNLNAGSITFRIFYPQNRDKKQYTYYIINKFQFYETEKCNIGGGSSPRFPNKENHKNRNQSSKEVFKQQGTKGGLQCLTN